MTLINGGVGLGICQPCRSPGAFWYPSKDPLMVEWFGPGVWVCDSCCATPQRAQERITADIARRRILHAEQRAQANA